MSNNSGHQNQQPPPPGYNPNYNYNYNAYHPNPNIPPPQYDHQYYMQPTSTHTSSGSLSSTIPPPIHHYAPASSTHIPQYDMSHLPLTSGSLPAGSHTMPHPGHLPPQNQYYKQEIPPAGGPYPSTSIASGMASGSMNVSGGIPPSSKITPENFTSDRLEAKSYMDLIELCKSVYPDQFEVNKPDSKLVEKVDEAFRFATTGEYIDDEKFKKKMKELFGPKSNPLIASIMNQKSLFIFRLNQPATTEKELKPVKETKKTTKKAAAAAAAAGAVGDAASLDGTATVTATGKVKTTVKKEKKTKEEKMEEKLLKKKEKEESMLLKKEKKEKKEKKNKASDTADGGKSIEGGKDGGRTGEIGVSEVREGKPDENEDSDEKNEEERKGEGKSEGEEKKEKTKTTKTKVTKSNKPTFSEIEKRTLEDDNISYDGEYLNLLKEKDLEEICRLYKKERRPDEVEEDEEEGDAESLWKYKNIVDLPCINRLINKLNTSTTASGSTASTFNVSLEAKELLSHGVQYLIKNLLEDSIESWKFRNNLISFQHYDNIIEKLTKYDEEIKKNNKNKEEIIKNQHQLLMTTCLRWGPSVKNLLIDEETSSIDFYYDYLMKDEEQLKEKMLTYDKERHKIGGIKRKMNMGEYEPNWWEIDAAALKDGGANLSWDDMAAIYFRDEISKKYSLGPYRKKLPKKAQEMQELQAGTTGTSKSSALPSSSTDILLEGMMETDLVHNEYENTKMKNLSRDHHNLDASHSSSSSSLPSYLNNPIPLKINEKEITPVDILSALEKTGSNSLYFLRGHARLINNSLEEKISEWKVNHS